MLYHEDTAIDRLETPQSQVIMTSNEDPMAPDLFNQMVKYSPHVDHKDLHMRRECVLVDELGDQGRKSNAQYDYLN